MKTWHKELLVVSSILFATWFLFTGTLVELLGTLAVILTFCHLQVSVRLQEAQKVSKDKVECYKTLTTYIVMKEILWLSYFILLGAYSALAGVVMFALYPLWRHLYASYRT